MLILGFENESEVGEKKQKILGLGEISQKKLSLWFSVYTYNYGF